MEASGYDAAMNLINDLRAKIEKHGWAVRHVVDEDESLCLSYTVGLTAHGHPEVVMTGLPPEVGQAFLNLVGEVVVHDGGRLEAGTLTDELTDGPPLPVIAVTDKTDLTAIESIYGDVPVHQVVWTDSAGHLPWDAEFANPPGSQPLLGSR